MTPSFLHELHAVNVQNSKKRAADDFLANQFFQSPKSWITNIENGVLLTQGLLKGVKNSPTLALLLLIPLTWELSWKPKEWNCHKYGNNTTNDKSQPPSAHPSWIGSCKTKAVGRRKCYLLYKLLMGWIGTVFIICYTYWLTMGIFQERLDHCQVCLYSFWKYFSFWNVSFHVQYANSFILLYTSLCTYLSTSTSKSV